MPRETCYGRTYYTFRSCVYGCNDLRVQKKAMAYGLMADEGASDLNGWELVIL